MPRGAGQRGRQRGVYNTTSREDKERLIRAFEENRDYLELADGLGINSGTAHGIIARHQQGMPVAAARGGRRADQVVLTDAIVQQMVNIIEEHPAYTLKQIQEALAIEISVSTIARGLDGALITTKKLDDASIERNSQRVKNERRAYAAWFMAEAVHGTVIYVDETCFNLYTRRTRGRALQGQRAVRQVLGSKGPNLNLVMAISPGTGVVYFELARGTMNQVRFGFFLENLAVVLGEANAFIIMDNATVHGRAEMEHPGHIIKKLPPYSPMLNPIENSFSTLKWAVKNKLNEDAVRAQIFDRAAAAQQHQTLVEYRLQILDGLIRPLLEDMETISAQKCTNWNNRVFGFLPRCMDMQEIIM